MGRFIWIIQWGTMSPYKKGTEGRSQRRDGTMEAEVRVMEEAANQGKQEAPRNWKKQGNRFFLEPAEGTQPILEFSASELHINRFVWF